MKKYKATGEAESDTYSNKWARDGFSGADSTESLFPAKWSYTKLPKGHQEDGEQTTKDINSPFDILSIPVGPMYVNSILFNNSKILKHQKVAGKLLKRKI